METIAKGTAVTNRGNGHPATVEAVDLQASQGPSALLRYEANERNGLRPGDHETGWALLADLEVAIRVDAGAEAFGAVFPLRWGADRPIIEALWGEADVRREDSFVFDGAGRFRRVRGPGQPFAPDNPEGFRLVGDPRPPSTRVDAFMQPVDLPGGDDPLLGPGRFEEARRRAASPSPFIPNLREILDQPGVAVVRYDADVEAVSDGSGGRRPGDVLVTATIRIPARTS